MTAIETGEVEGAAGPETDMNSNPLCEANFPINLITSSLMEEVKPMPGRSYGQFCGLARTLDVVGDRWSLLIVRELLLGPMRYGELLASLGGIATNLLADRLRSLESSGVIERRLGQTSGVVYALTPWGGQLREAIESLIRWSNPLMISGPGVDVMHPRWLAVALPALLRGRTAKVPVQLGIEAAGSFMTLRIDKDGPEVTLQPDGRPDTVLKADPDAILGLVAGVLTVDEVLSGASFEGDMRVLTAALGLVQA
jgi:DNA-binding HxlR family transcriptional regulator